MSDHKCAYCEKPCECRDFMYDDPDFEGQFPDDFDCIGCEDCAP